MRRILASAIALLISTSAFAGAKIPSAKFFDVSSIRVKDTEEVDTILSKLGEALKADKNRRLTVIVHADERYGLLANVYIADQRGKRLVKALKKYGAKGKQVRHEAVGHNGVENTRNTSLIIFEFSDEVK